MRIYRKQIERITIIGDEPTKRKALDYCLKHGFRIIRSGPKTIAKYGYDVGKYKVVAEREIVTE